MALKGFFARRAPHGEPQTLETTENLAGRRDSVERAFSDEMTGSMSLNLRGTVLAAGSAATILLLVEFSTEWLDDTEWDLSGLAAVVMRGTFWASIFFLLLCLGFASYAVWPKRRWADLQAERMRCLGKGDMERSTRLLLQMVERQRATNELKSVVLQIAAVPMALAALLVLVQLLIFTISAEPVGPARATAPEEEPDLPETGLPTAAEQKRLAGTYAPRVWLHNRERYGPIDPVDFLAGSRLVWKLTKGSRTLSGRGQVEAARLGRHCGARCYAFAGFRANELTRPHEERPERPADLGTGRGFALEPNEAARRGQVGRAPDVPMLYEFRRVGAELRINYWLFYGYSRPNDPRAERVGDVSSHDGDWENVEVALDAEEGTPLAVYFYGHGAPTRRPWTRVCKVGPDVDDCTSEAPGHPVVYSGLSSHASYPEPGRVVVHGDLGSAADVTEAGRPWETWERPNGLRPAKDEPWWGFGGAWGRAKRIPGTTGPLGPSRWKLPASPDPGDLTAHP